MGRCGIFTTFADFDVSHSKNVDGFTLRSPRLADLIAPASPTLQWYNSLAASCGRVRHESSSSHWDSLYFRSYLLLCRHWSRPGPHPRRQSLLVAHRVRRGSAENPAGLRRRPEHADSDCRFLARDAGIPGRSVQLPHTPRI